MDSAMMPGVDDYDVPELPAGILLDLDGTLVDTTYVHTLCWWQALQQYGHTVSMARLHRAVGMGPDALLPHILGPQHDPRHDEDIVTAHDVLFATWHDRIEALPGARRLLSWCHEHAITVALASSSGERDLHAMLDILDQPDIDVLTTGSDVDRSKPSPDLLEVALERTGLEADEVLFVGDAVWDVEAANRLGIACVALECGGTGRAELLAAGAVDTFADPEAFLQALRSGCLSGRLGLESHQELAQPALRR